MYGCNQNTRDAEEGRRVQESDKYKPDRGIASGGGNTNPLWYAFGTNFTSPSVHGVVVV